LVWRIEFETAATKELAKLDKRLTTPSNRNVIASAAKQSSHRAHIGFSLTNQSLTARLDCFASLAMTGRGDYASAIPSSSASMLDASVACVNRAPAAALPPEGSSATQPSKAFVPSPV
jgi:hypothetical protein